MFFFLGYFFLFTPKRLSQAVPYPLATQTAIDPGLLGFLAANPVSGRCILHRADSLALRGTSPQALSESSAPSSPVDIVTPPSLLLDMQPGSPASLLLWWRLCMHESTPVPAVSPCVAPATDFHTFMP